MGTFLPIMNANRSKLERKAAEEVVKSIVQEKPTFYHFLLFEVYKTSHQGTLMKPKQYEKYFVLCYHAGWMVCPYVPGRLCPTSKRASQLILKRVAAIYLVFTCKNIKNRKLNSNEQWHWKRMARNESRAAGLAVLLDLLPLSFAEDYEVIVALVESMFEVGKSVPFR